MHRKAPLAGPFLYAFGEQSASLRIDLALAYGVFDRLSRASDLGRVISPGNGGAR
jgi:hypothetical protein